MERVETFAGRLEVQQIFALTGKRRTKNRVAGCRVVAGQAFSAPSYRYKVIRNGEVLCPESPIHSLFHFKEQVQEVRRRRGVSTKRCGRLVDYGVGTRRHARGKQPSPFTHSRKSTLALGGSLHLFVLYWCCPCRRCGNAGGEGYGVRAEP